MTPQWEKRLNLTIVIYQYLLLDLSKEESIKIALEQYDIENNELLVLEYVIDHIQELETMINPVLNKTWSWNRMNYFDRAIILEAISENIVLETPKAIIIDQALITARKYSIDDSYKYINALLEKLIICKSTS